MGCSVWRRKGPEENLDPLPVPKGATGELERFCSRTWSDKTQENGFRLKEGDFRIGASKKFFPVREVRHWNRLSRCPIPGSVSSSVSLLAAATRKNKGTYIIRCHIQLT